MSNHVLIITDHAGDAKKLKHLLPIAEDGPFEVEWIRSLQQANERLAGDGIDVILMDFTLADSDGINTFDELFKAAPTVPIVTMVSEDEIDLARKAVQRGAQGYLLKGHFHNSLVPQALRNTIERKRVEESLFVEKERAEVTLNSIGDAVISTDRSGKITYLNLTAERMTGWMKDEAVERPVEEVLQLINSVTRQSSDNPIKKVIRENRPHALLANSILVRRDGVEIPIEDSTAPIYDRRGRVTGAVIVFRDIGFAQALMDQKMAHMAQHDFLTDLPNRLLLNDRLAHTIALSNRHSSELAVLFLDLDNFKTINDSLGHESGDLLLKSVANRLACSIRSSDTVSRYGGDEFVILVAGGRQEDAASIAEKVLNALALPHNIQGNELHISASIGISVFPADGKDAETLIKNADAAMYHAKNGGRNTYQFFNAEMNRRALERHLIETDLRRALEKQEFVLVYQPKINLASGAITGVEALLRWRHPKRGLVLPDQFISIAEDCGLIVPIGRWVMQEACRQTKVWVKAGMAHTTTAINVSALEFRRPDFLPTVRKILDECGLDPHFLEFELTETILMTDCQSSSDILHALKGIGVTIAVDDFGTGYSSLNYLQKFPIDVLKIDQSFVRGIVENPGKRIIVTAVIGMGTSLKHRVVAEGIETIEQLDFLNEQRCHEGQGHYFSLPLNAEHCTSLLTNGISESLIHPAQIN